MKIGIENLVDWGRGYGQLELGDIQSVTYHEIENDYTVSISLKGSPNQNLYIENISTEEEAKEIANKLWSLVQEDSHLQMYNFRRPKTQNRADELEEEE